MIFNCPCHFYISDFEDLLRFWTTSTDQPTPSTTLFTASSSSTVSSPSNASSASSDFQKMLAARFEQNESRMEGYII